MGSTKSTKRLIIYGFLQGTVLEPILFIMYINQLFELDCQSALISCDDTVLLIEAESWDCVESIANSHLQHLLIDIVKYCCSLFIELCNTVGKYSLMRQTRTFLR